MMTTFFGFDVERESRLLYGSVLQYPKGLLERRVRFVTKTVNPLTCAG